MGPFTFDILVQKADFILMKRNTFWYTDIYKNKIIYEDLIPTEVYTSKILFIFGCNPQEWLSILKQISTLHLVILGGTDIPFVNGNIQNLLVELPNTHFFITNWLGIHPRCTFLPLFPTYYVSYFSFEYTKRNLFGIPFLRINSEARLEFYETIQTLPEIHQYFLKELPNKEYQEALSSLYFCCCPMGNGFDTHRFWESLYFASIPIVKKHPFYDTLLFHYPNIPMIVIDEWKDLPRCIENLSIEKYNELWKDTSLQMLTHTYWNSKIISIMNESSYQ